MRVAFDANVAKNAPLKFRPLQAHVDVKLGETMMVFYEVTNMAKEPVRAAASFNVTPYKIGRYFEKLECFLLPGADVRAGQASETACRLLRLARDGQGLAGGRRARNHAFIYLLPG